MRIGALEAGSLDKVAALERITAQIEATRVALSSALAEKVGFERVRERTAVAAREFGTAQGILSQLESDLERLITERETLAGLVLPEKPQLEQREKAERPTPTKFHFCRSKL